MCGEVATWREMVFASCCSNLIGKTSHVMQGLPLSRRVRRRYHVIEEARQRPRRPSTLPTGSEVRPPRCISELDVWVQEVQDLATIESLRRAIRALSQPNAAPDPSPRCYCQILRCQSKSTYWCHSSSQPFLLAKFSIRAAAAIKGFSGQERSRTEVTTATGASTKPHI